MHFLRKILLVYALTLVMCTLQILTAFAQNIPVENTLVKHSGEYIVFNAYGNENSDTRKSMSVSAAIPFFDDFTYEGPYPMPNLWLDKEVYVNRNLARNAPSIGVATLDAYNATGYIHSTASIGATPFLADALTSLPIQFGGKTSNVFLSFSYQAGGFGNMPEAQDSLLVQFFSPDENKWYTVWKTPGNIGTEFQFSLLPVSDPKFLKDGFKFRFVNYCSIPQSDNMSLAGNADFWHIDYVFLDANRNATDVIYHDIAMAGNFTALFPPYEKIPWSHYLSAGTDILAPSMPLIIKNNDNSGRKLKERFISLRETISNTQYDTLLAGAENIASGNQLTLNFPFSLIPVNNGLDSANLLLYAGFETDGFDRAINNSLFKTIKLNNTYAYDDGSSEASYGIIGEGAQNAMFAYKFTMLKPDSLHAVEIYFNTILSQALIKPFYLNIWDVNKDGKPGNLIYSKEGTKPRYSTILDLATIYPLDSTIALPDSFFVGWMQTAAYSLNVGFDINRDASDYMFYNIDGTWTPSEMNGAVMIRPVLGKSLVSSVPRETIADFSISPNPANDFANISFTNNTVTPRLVRVLHMSGQVLYSQTTTDNTLTIDTQNFASGVYILHITEGKNYYTKKFIITH